MLTALFVSGIIGLVVVLWIVVAAVRRARSDGGVGKDRLGGR